MPTKSSTLSSSYYYCFLSLICISLCQYLRVTTAFSETIPLLRPPKISPATGLTNRWYTWKEGQIIRYQVAGPVEGKAVVLLHGLFCNSDHWRKTLVELPKSGFRVYALDFWGCGWSSKPPPHSDLAQKCNGETHRFDHIPSILHNVALKSSDGKRTRIVDMELRHPFGSPYNFYTWSDLLTDFCKHVVLTDNTTTHTCTRSREVSLVCNSIGCSIGWQAVMDTPDMYSGVFAISPNFRELNPAEIPFPRWTMPMIRGIQQCLRQTFVGQALFDMLAKPDMVAWMLKGQPYAVKKAVDDTLVKVLLDPLLTQGTRQVIFDLLSYSAGPLPEQQLSSTLFPPDTPVWVCYGQSDPWTSGPRVEALKSLVPVEIVKGFSGVGHCPHDEAPELVHPLLLEFLNRVQPRMISQTNDDEDVTLPVKIIH
jgi:pimeloyl-ACP methyl ester carboxylesterase